MRFVTYVPFIRMSLSRVYSSIPNSRRCVPFRSSAFTLTLREPGNQERSRRDALSTLITFRGVKGLSLAFRSRVLLLRSIYKKATRKTCGVRLNCYFTISWEVVHSISCERYVNQLCILRRVFFYCIEVINLSIILIKSNKRYMNITNFIQLWMPCII